MERSEFQRNLDRLKNKWPRIFSDEQVGLLWDRWQKLPDGVFDTSIAMLLFKCTAIPSGERVQEEIDLMISIRQRAHSVSQPEKHNGCKDCDSKGYMLAQNNAGNETPFLCTSCGGKNTGMNFPLPRWADVERQGYRHKRRPISFHAIQNAAWIDADREKYSAALIGIYNTVQRAMLEKDNRGIGGIKMLTQLNSQQIFNIYELMQQGNTEHELIRKHNRVYTSLNF